jgi:hypothetical protein
MTTGCEIRPSICPDLRSPNRRRDHGGLLGRSLILWLDHPRAETGDTYLCFGLLAFLSPITSTYLIPIPQRSRPNPVAR